MADNINISIEEQNIDLGIDAAVILSVSNYSAPPVVFAVQGSGVYVQTSGTVQFANSNNITFGLSTNRMTASFSESTHAHNYIPIGNSTQYNTSVLSTKFMQSASSSVFAKTGFTTVATAGIEFVGTLNTDGLRVGVPAYLTTGGGGGALSFSAGGSSDTLASVIFSNSNNVSFGLVGSTITASASYSAEVQSAEPRVISINGTSGSLTFNAGTFMSLSHDGLSFTYYVTDTSAITSAAFPSANTTKFAGAGFTTTATAGTEVVATHDSLGLKLAVPAYLTTAQSPGAYLLTAAISDHTHGSNISISATSNATETLMRFSSSSNGLTVVVPAYLTTAMNSTEPHVKEVNASNGTIYASVNLRESTNITLSADGASIKFSVADAIPLGNSTAYNTTVLSTVFQTAGAYLTTAANSTHSHGTISFSTTGGTDATYSSASNGLTISLPKWITTYTPAGGASDWSCSTTLGSGITIITGAAINTLSYGNFLTTAMQSACSSNFQSTGAYLTTAAVSNHTHSDLYVNTSVSANFLTTAMQSACSSNFQSTGAYLTTAMQSGCTSAFWGTANAFLTTAMQSACTSVLMPSANASNFVGLGSTAITGGSATINSTGLMINIPVATGYIGLASTGVTGFNATINSSQLLMSVVDGSIYFNDSNGISFGISTAGSSSTVTASYNSSHTHGSNVSISATSNSTETLMRFSSSSNGLTVVVPAYLTTAMQSACTSVFAYTSVSNSFIRSWELEGNNTAGTTGSLQSSILYLSGGNNVTLSGNSNTIVFSIPNVITTAMQSACTSVLMPISYSSAFQTATLASTFLTTQSAHTGFVGLATTYITGGSATINSSQISILIPLGTVYFQDSNGHSFSSSVGTGTASLNTTIYIVV